jgi:CheY-like chemotaxis protein
MLTSTQQAEGPQRTVLIVDDDPDILEALRQVLSDAGYAVVGAGNGRAGLEYLRHAPSPDAILLDLFMPMMNGWEFLREVAKSERMMHVPIIVVTAAGPHWGYPLPAGRIMHKPIQRERLLHMLRQVVAD